MVQLHLFCNGCREICEIGSESLPQKYRNIFPGPKDVAYCFTCCKCSGEGVQFSHTNKNDYELAITGLYNLSQYSSDEYVCVKDLASFLVSHKDVLHKGSQHSLLDDDKYLKKQLFAVLNRSKDVFGKDSVGEARFRLLPAVFEGAQEYAESSFASAPQQSSVARSSSKVKPQKPLARSERKKKNDHEPKIKIHRRKSQPEPSAEKGTRGTRRQRGLQPEPYSPLASSTAFMTAVSDDSGASSRLALVVTSKQDQDRSQAQSAAEENNFTSATTSTKPRRRKSAPAVQTIKPSEQDTALTEFHTPKPGSTRSRQPKSTSAALKTTSIFLTPTSPPKLKPTASPGKQVKDSSPLYALTELSASSRKRKSLSQEGGSTAEPATNSKKPFVLKKMNTNFLSLLNKKSKKMDEEKENILDDGWTAKEVAQLRLVHSKTRPHIDFWEDVSSRMGSRTAVECSRKFQSFYPTPAKRTKKSARTPAEAGPSPLHEKKGTIKRRRKLRALSEMAGKNFAGHDAYASKEEYGFDLDVSFDDADELFKGRNVYEDDSESDEEGSVKPIEQSPGLLKPIDYAAMDGYIQKLKRRPAPREMIPLNPLKLTFKTDHELRKDADYVAKLSHDITKQTTEILEEDVISDYYFSEGDSDSMEL